MKVTCSGRNVTGGQGATSVTQITPAPASGPTAKDVKQLVQAQRAAFLKSRGAFESKERASLTPQPVPWVWAAAASGGGSFAVAPGVSAPEQSAGEGGTVKAPVRTLPGIDEGVRSFEGEAELLTCKLQ